MGRIGLGRLVQYRCIHDVRRIENSKTGTNTS
jgi:hypothetical protein